MFTMFLSLFLRARNVSHPRPGSSRSRRPSGESIHGRHSDAGAAVLSDVFGCRSHVILPTNPRPGGYHVCSRWAVILVLVTALACSGGGIAAQATPDFSTWPVVYHDTFENDQSGWKVNIVVTDEIAIRSYSDGSYRIEITDDSRVAWSQIPSLSRRESEITDDSRVAWSQIPGARSFCDFVADVEVRDFEGQGQFGVVFRYGDGDNFYLFAIRTNGDFRFRKQQDDEWDTLVDWTPSDAFRGDGANTIAVVAMHDTFIFSLNGIQLVEVTNAEYLQGEIGLMAGTLEESWFGVSFDAITVRTDPEAAASAAVCEAEMQWPLATLGVPYVHALEFSPDGRYLAIGGGEVAELIATDEWSVTRILYGHEDSVDSVAFSPDGGLLATGGSDGAVRIWHVETGKLHATLLNPDRRETLLGAQPPAIYSTAFSPDGALLATGNGDGTVRIWNLATVEEHAILRGPARRGGGFWGFSPGPSDRAVHSCRRVSGGRYLRCLYEGWRVTSRGAQDRRH